MKPERVQDAMSEMLEEVQELRAKLDLLIKALEIRGIEISPAVEHKYKVEFFLEAEKNTEHIKEVIEKIGWES